MTMNRTPEQKWACNATGAVLLERVSGCDDSPFNCGEWQIVCIASVPPISNDKQPVSNVRRPLTRREVSPKRSLLKRLLSAVLKR